MNRSLLRYLSGVVLLVLPFALPAQVEAPDLHFLAGEMVDDQLDPQAALDQPRFCIAEGEAGGGVALEEGISSEVMAELSGMGHEVEPVSGHGRALFGRGQIIKRDPESGVLCGGSDPRADGCAMSL